MGVKQDFLKELRDNLRKYPSGAVDDYIEYYDELIAEHVARGEKESAVLAKIGTPQDIAASFKQDVAIDRAVKRPTPSNGVKAFIAVLSVLSLPLVIPLFVVFGALLVAVVALFVSGFAVVAAGMLGSIGAVIDMAINVGGGNAPWYLLLLVTGAALVAFCLAFELCRGLLFSSRWITRTLIHKLNSWRNKRKGQ
ncbi:MAG TPA: DUF1700 domain-containing protein [Candidatus Saccharimonadales bacterium]|nr:DUF1700 domain-containing protein [Candidatus Saccharimonadales bacterium]